MAKKNNTNPSPVPIKDVLSKLSIDELNIKGKRVFIRADFNVPLDDNLRITDDGRIRSTLPTINYAIDEGAKVVLASHLGRPKGKPDPRYSLAPVAARLGELLGRPVSLAPGCVGPEIEAQARALAPGQILMLENLRFHPGEEKNDEAFAQELAILGDVYVDDAF